MSSHVQLTQTTSEMIKVMLEPKDTQIQSTVLESNQQIIQHTILLLAEGGMQAATLQAVADRIGLSRGFVTRRYASKEQLFIQVLDYLKDWFNQIVADATYRQHGVTAIESLIKSLADQSFEHSTKFKAYFWLCCFGQGANRQLNRHLMAARKGLAAIYKQWLKEALVLEEIARNADLEMMADLMMSSVIGLVHSWMINPKFNLELRLRQLAEIHIRNMFKNSHLYYSTNYWGE